jgi:recombination protein RecT
MSMQNGNGNGNARAIQTIDPRQATLKDLLSRALPAMKQVLPRHLTPERLVKVALAATGRNQDLLACTADSILDCVMQAAQLGLEPGGPLGHAYLIPYKNKCTLIVGYKGLIELARRSGEIDSIEARVVYERDEFRVAYGLNPVLEHVPNLSGDPGQLIMVYAIARLRGGGVQAEVMTRSQVNAIRQRSRASGSGPWVTDYDEMARKTVVRRVCKYLPLSVELADVLEGEARVEEHHAATVSAGLLAPATGKPALESGSASPLPDAGPSGADAGADVAGGDGNENMDAEPPSDPPQSQPAARQPAIDHAARIRAAKSVRELNAAAAEASKAVSGEEAVALVKLVDERRGQLSAGTQS